MRAHVHFTESLPAIVAILALSGFVLPVLTTIVAWITVVLKLLAFVTVLNMNEGYDNCGATVTKVLMYATSDLTVFVFGAISFAYMLANTTDNSDF